MNIRTPQLPQLDLSTSSFEKPFFVDMEAFFEFSFWISEELLDLEARFAGKVVSPCPISSSNAPDSVQPMKKAR